MQEIERLSLVDKSYEIIKNDILSKNFREGDKIPSENQLSNALGVSRVIVRMALEKLREEHFIVTFQGKGSFVANRNNFLISSPKKFPLTYEEFRDIMEFRAGIEYSAIKRAVSEGEDGELSKILALAKEMETAANNPEKFTRLDYDFHYQIIKASKNAMFIKMTDFASDRIYLALETMNRLVDSDKWAIDLHKEIARLIIRRDSKGAIDLLKRNGEYNLARMHEIFTNNNFSQEKTK